MSQNHLTGTGGGDVVKQALDGGATDAECTISEGDEFSANVRMREVENLKEAGSRGAGLRDPDRQARPARPTPPISRPRASGSMVASAIELADITTRRSARRPAGRRRTGRDSPATCNSTARDVERLETAVQDRPGARAPRTPRSTPTRASPTPKARPSTRIWAAASSPTRAASRASTAPATARSRPFRWRATANPWSAITGISIARGFAGLEPPGAGRPHGRRARAAPPEPAQGGDAAGAGGLRAAHGPHVCWAASSKPCTAMSIYRQASFLAGKLGEKVAAEGLTVIDDGTIPGLFGTSPFDDEGVPSRRTVVIERGVLKSYLLNSYTARKLGMKTTGNASRGLTGNAGHRPRQSLHREGRSRAGRDPGIDSPTASTSPS